MGAGRWVRGEDNILTGAQLLRMWGQSFNHSCLTQSGPAVQVLGTLPEAMCRSADKNVGRLFTPAGRLDWPRQADSVRSCRAVAKLCPLRELLR